MSKTILFETIQFSISTQFSSILHMERNISVVTIPGQSENDGNEWKFRIPQSSRITGTSPSDCLVSQQDTHWGVLLLCREAVCVF